MMMLGTIPIFLHDIPIIIDNVTQDGMIKDMIGETKEMMNILYKIWQGEL